MVIDKEALVQALGNGQSSCEETTGMIGNEYTHCGAPPAGLVLSEHGKRIYFMCAQCLTHNVRNREAIFIAGTEEAMQSVRR